MQQIVNFLIKYKNTLLFLLLFSISIYLTVQAHAYHKSKFVSSANMVTGGFYEWWNNIESYFSLEEYNNRLKKENKQLRNRILELTGKDSVSIQHDSTEYGDQYWFLSAEIISNNYAKRDNYLLIDKGATDSVEVGMGVITSEGIVGIVEEASENYARVISILNTNSAINARLKKSDYFGTLVWNGGDPNIVQLTYIPKIANLQKGDTVITGGKSFIFPEGIPIGVIRDFKLEEEGTYYRIEVRLFNDMTNLGYVYLIGNIDKKELETLKKPGNE